MKLAAAQGIADVVADEDLSEDYIIPSVFNRDVAPAVAKAVVEEAQARRDRPRLRGDGHLLDDRVAATAAEWQRCASSSPAPAA